jgi:predicted RNase H-like nuclease (RuvC/YqgF family)
LKPPHTEIFAIDVLITFVAIRMSTTRKTKVEEVPVVGTVRSCDRCKEKKIRCNNGVPCNQCILHNTTCTYNAPCRRKRYAVNSSDLANQVNQEAEIKIKKLEEQLNAYKKRVQELEKSLTQYLSPVGVFNSFALIYN